MGVTTDRAAHVEWAGGGDPGAEWAASPALVPPFPLFTGARLGRHSFAQPPHARSKNALTGTLDPGLGRAWPLMEVLEFSENQLRGPIPPSFAAMGRLWKLYL